MKHVSGGISNERTRKYKFAYCGGIQIVGMGEGGCSQKKAEKYEELQKEVDALVEKYEVTGTEMFGAECDLDGQQPLLDDEELMELADKLVAHEDGWEL